MGENAMFCYQCEQTAQGQGCTKGGVCGKTPVTAGLQDLLIHALRGLSLYAVEGEKKGVKDADLDAFVFEALFATLTNVNFDDGRLAALIKKTVSLRDQLKAKVSAAGGNTDFSEDAASFIPEDTLDCLQAQAVSAGLKADASINPDILSLQHILLFGIKGVAAYADHARILGQQDHSIITFIYQALAAPFNKDLEITIF